MSRSVDFHCAVHSDHTTHGGVGGTHGEQIGEMTATPNNNLKESATENKLGHDDTTQPVSWMPDKTDDSDLIFKIPEGSFCLLDNIAHSFFSQLSPIAMIFTFKHYDTFRIRMYRR
jgi:hypothetical protein